MKISSFVFMFTVSLMMYCMLSCSKTPRVSCDPAINEWAYAHQKEFEFATKSQIAELPFNQADAIFNGSSPKKKAHIWTEKLYQYASSRDMNDAEREHYLSITTYFNEHYFGTKRGLDELRNVALNWEKVLIEDFGWSMEDLFWGAYTWMSKEEYIESLLVQSMQLYRSFDDSTAIVDTTIVDPNPELKDCNCNNNIGCTGNIEGDTCYKRFNCYEVYKCGLFQISLCKGVCE